MIKAVVRVAIFLLPAVTLIASGCGSDKLSAEGLRERLVGKSKEKALDFLGRPLYGIMKNGFAVTYKDERQEDDWPFKDVIVKRVNWDAVLESDTWVYQRKADAPHMTYVRFKDGLCTDVYKEK